MQTHILSRATHLVAAFCCVVLMMAVRPAAAVPGYHITNDKSAQLAVQQYAGNNFLFNAVTYQAFLDRNLWRLTLAAHDALAKEPNNIALKCSFTMAYWQSQSPVGVHEDVPTAARTQLQGMYAEALRDTKEAVQKLPNSVSAHLNYGYYLQWFVMGMEKVPAMLREYQAAVRLRPDLGYVHAALAQAYAGSGDYGTATSDKIIAECKRAVALDSRLIEPYSTMAAAYCWKNDYRSANIYLNKYLKLNPEGIRNEGTFRMKQSIEQELAKS